MDCSTKGCTNEAVHKTMYGTFCIKCWEKKIKETRYFLSRLRFFEGI